MDRNTEREISVESGLAETECLRNENLILEQAHTKIPSKFNDESVSSDDQSKSSSQCHSPDSGYSSGKIAHPLVIENETNDKIESDAVPGIELNYNDTDVTVSTTELSSECTIEPTIVPTSKEQQQPQNRLDAPVESEDFDETEATKENENPTNVDRKYSIVHSKFNDFKFVKPHAHPTIPQPDPKSKRGKRKTPRVPPATKRSKQSTSATKRAPQKGKSPN